MREQDVLLSLSDKTIKKEATMQVTYNGFTGELVKLERTSANVTLTVSLNLQEQKCQHNRWDYDLSIYDSEKQVTHSFTGVKLEYVKFLGGSVSFSG